MQEYGIDSRQATSRCAACQCAVHLSSTCNTHTHTHRDMRRQCTFKIFAYHQQESLKLCEDRDRKYKNSLWTVACWQLAGHPMAARYARNAVRMCGDWRHTRIALVRTSQATQRQAYYMC